MANEEMRYDNTRRSREDIEQEMLELRDTCRELNNRLESKERELEEWMIDARENAQEVGRLRAALKATNALLEFYLPKGV